MNMYNPEKLVSVSRYQNYFPTLSHDIQRDVYSRMAELIAEEKHMKISLNSFGTDAGFVYSFPETHGNEARFNIVRCPYFETCKRYGCPEITRCFCDGDDAGYGNLHPKLIWGRTKTIGRGGDCCDFLLEYEE